MSDLEWVVTEIQTKAGPPERIKYTTQGVRTGRWVKQSSTAPSSAETSCTEHEVQN